MPYYGYYGGYGDFFANNIYCILLIPVLLLSLWAQAQVSGNFKRYSGVANRRRLTGAQAAEAVLRAHGVYNVAIRPCSGNLTDHYDPRDNSISLSENVYNSTSIAAVGVAAHEAGHAVQYAENYGPVRLRTAIIPATQIGSKFSFILLLVGIGLRGGKGVKNAADFTASGGRYGTAVIFATLSASYVGGGYSSGNAAKAFSAGISTTLTLLGFSLAMVLIGKFLVPGVARFPGAVTVGGIVGEAYGKRARVLTGLFSFLCCAGVVGAQMESIGMVFHVLLGVEHHMGVLLGCGIVLLYTTFGGLQSVIFADILQFVLLAGGMPVLLILALLKAGGPGPVLEALPASYFDPFNGTTAAGFVSLFLSMMLGEALAPPYTQRLLIGRNAKGTARGTILSGLFSIPFFFVTGGIGLTAYALHVTNESASAMSASGG